MYSIFLALILCRLLSAIYNKWVINENGVFYQTLFSKKFLSWDKISDIGICCYKDPDIPLSSSRNHVGNPVEIAIYFSKRHLTEYEQKNFFTKHLCVMKELTIFKKMIFVTVPLTEDVENTFELVAKFCTKYTSLPITRFNSFILKYK